MMEHKAFLFDHNTFDRDVRATLEQSLISGETIPLVSFINANLGALRDPYEGEPLTADWEALIETKDAHQYGDFSLTKYYDPLADIGLGQSWESVQELLANELTLVLSPILGSTIGPKDDPFDPGKMGSYFQSTQQAIRNYEYLLEFAKRKRSDDLTQAVQMLEKAVNAETGLYVTF